MIDETFNENKNFKKNEKRVLTRLVLQFTNVYNTLKKRKRKNN